MPLNRYKQNLIDIITHPLVRQQKPRIILVTPPPVNEYACEDNDRAKGILVPRRRADHTRMYADAVREVAKEVQVMDVALLDLWSLMMTHAGWSEGDHPLPGSKSIAPNPFLRMLLHDGESMRRTSTSNAMRNLHMMARSTFHEYRLHSLATGDHADHCQELARSVA